MASRAGRREFGVHARAGTDAAQDRLHGGDVGAARRARPGPVRRADAGGRTQWRQARRRASGDHQRGQPAQDRSRAAAGRQADRKGQGADHHRHQFLQCDDGGAPQSHREGGLPDRLERGTVADRRRAVLAVLLLELLAERHAGGSGRQVCDGQGLQAPLPHGAELSGGQRLPGRIQAVLQGRGRERSLHVLAADGLLRRACRAGCSQAGCSVRVLSGGPGHPVSQTV